MDKAFSRPGNRFGLSEWSGAFGDLGTLVPFAAAYIAVLGVAPGGLLVAFGVALVVVGFVYRTPFPVQPMKAIGAAAASQTALLIGITPAVVTGATLATGLIWIVLGLTGWGKFIGAWIPRSALLGVVMGLGFSFMLEGVRFMASAPWIGGALLVVSLVLGGRRNMPGMLILLLLGVVVAIVQEPALAARLAGIRPELQLPAFGLASLSLADVWTGLILLALPQLPLTFGNAFLAIRDENNRLFPDRPTTERSIALSTGLMNVGSSALGGIPMCHGAGGMAGHVAFGAATGGSSVILGSALLTLGLFFADSVQVIFAAFPKPVLGVILFTAGLQLALGSRDDSGEKVDRFVMFATAGLAIFNVAVAVLFGWGAHHALKRGWIRL